MIVNNAYNESFHTFDLLTKFFFQIANRIHDFLIVHYRTRRWKHFEIVFLILSLFSSQILRSFIYFHSRIFIIIIFHYLEFIEKHFQNVIHVWTTSQTSFRFVFNHARNVWKIRIWIARFSKSSFEKVFSICFENVAFLILNLFSN